MTTPANRTPNKGRTLYVSDEAYQKVLERKHLLERRGSRSVSMNQALESLLRIRILDAPQEGVKTS